MQQLIFIDTEFTDFHSPKLISLGAVTLDGKHEFYVELTDYPTEQSSEFVKNVVEPLLDHSKFGKRSSEASAVFFTWLEGLGEEYWKITPDYISDWELSRELLEEFPGNISHEPFMLWTELSQIAWEQAKQLQTPDLNWFFAQVKKEFADGFQQYFLRHPNEKQHHALSDAKANREGWLKAMNWLDRQVY